MDTQQTLIRQQQATVKMLETPQATNTALESMYKLKVPLKIQGFVDGKNKDIRAIVVGDKVVQQWSERPARAILGPIYLKAVTVAQST